MIATVPVALLAWAIHSWDQLGVGATLLAVATWSGIAMTFAKPNPRAVDLESLVPEGRFTKSRQPELRPLVGARAGIFAPASGYRCAACWMTYRLEEGALVEVPEFSPTSPSDVSAIRYLTDLLSLEGEIQYLDEPDSPAESVPRREHPGVGGVEEDRDDEIARHEGRDDGQQ